jgi:hypothetical protein
MFYSLFLMKTRQISYARLWSLQYNIPKILLFLNRDSNSLSPLYRGHFFNYIRVNKLTMYLQNKSHNLVVKHKHMPVILLYYYVSENPQPAVYQIGLIDWLRRLQNEIEILNNILSTKLPPHFFKCKLFKDILPFFTFHANKAVRW